MRIDDEQVHYKHMRSMIMSCAMLWAAVACAPSMQNITRMPEFAVQSIVFAQPSTVKLSITNPNTQPLQLQNFTAHWVLEGEEQSQVQLLQTVLNAKESRTITATFALKPESSLYLLEKNISYRLDGKYHLDDKTQTPNYTLAQGLLASNTLWQAAKYRLDRSSLTLQEKVAVLRLEVSPALLVDMPIALQVGGVTIAKSTATGTVWEFNIDTLVMPEVLQNKQFEFSVRGSPILAISGLDPVTLPEQELLKGKTE